jgi:hypothetical protein
MPRFLHAAGPAVTLVALAASSPAALADSPLQIGDSGRTAASAAVLCMAEPASGEIRPLVQAGLFEPARRARAVVKADGIVVGNVTASQPTLSVWLAAGSQQVEVSLSRRVTDRYAFSVADGQCVMPDTTGNTLSPDGTLETAASGKSMATVPPGCALNPASGELQPFVNLFDNGGFVLNVSVNGVPLTQLSASHPSTPVFLQAGLNVIAAANGSLSVDHYVRDAGDGRCTLAP